MNVVGSVAAINAAARAAARAAGVAASTSPTAFALTNMMTMTRVPATPKLADLPPLPKYFKKKTRLHPHFRLRKVWANGEAWG